MTILKIFGVIFVTIATIGFFGAAAILIGKFVGANGDEHD